MIINKITLKNFYRYGNNEQTLDLSGSGITGIVGNNGYGKSTCIVDSLLFAFYGKSRNGIDDVVNRYIGKDCKVGVEFTEGGKNYKVLRYRAHTTQKNNVYIFENDVDISGHTITDTNAKIIDIIKMPYIAFTNSCVFSSELYSAFLGAQTADRLAVFENILSLKEVTAFYVETKKIIKELNENLIEVNTNLASAQAESNTITSTIDTYSSNAKTKLLTMKANKDEAKKTIENAKKRIEELSIINIDTEKAKLNNTTLKNEYLNQIDRLIKEKNSLIVIEPVEEMRIVDKYKDVNFEENKLLEEKYKEDLETMKTRENGYKLSSQTLDILKREVKARTLKYNSDQKEQGEKLNQLAVLATQMCPFCGQHLTSDKAEEEKVKLNKRIEELKSELEENDNKLNELENQYKEESENYNWLLGDYNRIKDNLNKNFIPNSDLVKEQYNAALKKLNEVQVLKTQNSLRIEEINKEIEETKSKSDKLEITNYTEEELNSISSKIEEQKTIISENEKSIAAIDASVSSVYDKKYVDDLKKKVSVIETKIDGIKINASNLEDEIKHYTYLSECFSNKSGGFKKYFIGEMIDVFNERVNQYLPFFFTEDVKISFDKDLNDEIKMDGFKVGFASFSQGQRQRAELAVSFALFDVARIFFSNDNKLLILDEMDKGLDKYGIKSMVNLLNGFDKQLRIFIVSHNPLLDEEISSKIKIERDENDFSKIVA